MPRLTEAEYLATMEPTPERVRLDESPPVAFWAAFTVNADRPLDRRFICHGRGTCEDAAAFAGLFEVEFGELRRRVRAGDAVQLKSGFFELHDVCRPRHSPVDDPELPLFGGRHIPNSGGGPGQMALDPPDVARMEA